MGFLFSDLHLMLPLFRADPSGNKKKRLLTLGVQDCWFTYPEVTSFLSRHGFRYDPIPDSEIELTDGFKWAEPGERQRYLNYIHQNTLFRLLGFDPQRVDSLDVYDGEGATIIHDLNRPIGEGLADRYDFILDGGTLEHVFSMSDAISNIIAMCKVGGRIIHLSPVDNLNHGFYNFNPTFFMDVYAANGFEKISLDYFARVARHDTARVDHYFIMNPATTTLLSPSHMTCLFGVFEKAQSQPFVVPQQGYCRRMWQEKAEPEPEPRSTLRRKLIDAIDKNILLSVLARRLQTITRARRVDL